MKGRKQELMLSFVLCGFFLCLGKGDRAVIRSWECVSLVDWNVWKQMERKRELL